MTPDEVLTHIKSLTDPTPEQLREASDLALLATGWTRLDHDFVYGTAWFKPDDDKAMWPSYRPHPCASIDDAVRWMVPEGYRLEMHVNPDDHPAPCCVYAWHPGKAEPPGCGQSADLAMALTIAGLAARLEDEK